MLGLNKEFLKLFRAIIAKLNNFGHDPFMNKQKAEVTKQNIPFEVIKNSKNQMLIYIS